MIVVISAALLRALLPHARAYGLQRALRPSTYATRRFSQQHITLRSRAAAWTHAATTLANNLSAAFGIGRHHTHHLAQDSRSRKRSPCEAS